jgi:MerR family transcriptional regulator, thiopeptide resistance regulator
VTQSYRVREFAALAGVTTKTLRHYDRIGLLSARRNGSGYRVYRDDDLVRVQQIAALKLLGFSLSQIRRVLEGGALPLREALRAQRAALMERRGQIDRALTAIDRAHDASMVEGRDTSVILAELMEVLAMAGVDVLKKYFSEDAWIRWRSRHASWPSSEWIALYREAQSGLDEDPAGQHAQDLARRCIALFEADTDGDPAVRTALRKASQNHDEWLSVVKAAMPEVDVERVSRFLANAAWARWDAPDGRSYETPMVRPRASASTTALLHEFATALDEDPRSARVQQLLARWAGLIEAQSGDDPQIREQIRRAAARWRNWPDGMRRWVAYTYGMNVTTWERVMALIDAARAA